ncbi:MAG: methyltransferase domain-containing protein [Thermoflavifilum sp.]|nr:methyltransferase domain-containing protein [Thermoflavifilum sp.]
MMREHISFDTIARHYRDIHDKNIHWSGASSSDYAKLKIQILARYEINETKEVLDLGCGDGLSAFYMKQFFPSWKLTGVDLSAESIAVAKERGIADAQFFHADGLDLPFQPQRFDLIFMAGVLHHVLPQQRAQFLSEACRVLRSSGTIYIFEHNPYHPFTQYAVHTCVFDKGVQLLSAKAAKRLLRDTGWQIDICKYLIFFPRYRVLQPLIRMESFFGAIPLGGQYFIRAYPRDSSVHCFPN